LASSNRTIVGLKLLTSLLRWDTHYGSNRTIVGLKLGDINERAQLISVQQSHHCGIETLKLCRHCIRETAAAIAPLWD